MQFMLGRSRLRQKLYRLRHQLSINLLMMTHRPTSLCMITHIERYIGYCSKYGPLIGKTTPFLLLKTYSPNICLDGRMHNKNSQSQPKFSPDRGNRGTLQQCLLFSLQWTSACHCTLWMYCRRVTDTTRWKFILVTPGVFVKVFLV
jgi:hypothetical protein